jgi:RNA recognition motif-containing protein
MFTSSQHVPERNQDATIYVGNLTANVSEELLWELFLQSGPVVNVHIPKDKVTNVHQVKMCIPFAPRSAECDTYPSGIRIC